MALYDWNHDGKKDFVDDYLEYNIYNECTKDNDNTNYSSNNYSNNSSDSGSGCSSWFWFSVIMIILGIITSCD